MWTQAPPSTVRTLDIVSPQPQPISSHANTDQLSVEELREALCRPLGLYAPAKPHPLFQVTHPPWNQSCASEVSEVSNLPQGPSSLSCRWNLDLELLLNWPCLFPFPGDTVLQDVFCLMPKSQHFLHFVKLFSALFCGAAKLFDVFWLIDI